jgi:LPS export ABC transporter protein LptC
MRRTLVVLSLAVGAAACQEKGVEPVVQLGVVDSADQVMDHMTTSIVADGVRRSVVTADTAYLYQNRQVAEMRVVVAHFFDNQGNQTSILTSRTGVYEVSRGTLEARGSVIVTATDGSGRKLTTEHLVYDKAMNQIRSDSAFVYDSPTGLLRGNSFSSDPEFRNIVTRQPRGRQRGDGVLLPGQP